MRLRTPGKICEGLWYLGVEESGIYLLEGRDEAMLISGGMSYILPEVISQLADFGISHEKISRHVLLHSHFDHVGVVPFFKRKLPGIQIYGSRRTWELLAMPKTVETINTFSRLVTERMRRELSGLTYDYEWRNDVTGLPVAENYRIDLGDIEAVIYETPGHSSCSISVYVPALKALFPSDAGGIPYRDTIFPTGNSNFTMFQSSLERLSCLEVNYLGADHYGYLSGEEAQGFIAATAQMAARLRRLVETIYTRKKDIDGTVRMLIAEHYRQNPDYFLSPEILTGVYRQMVRHISGAMNNNAAVTAGDP